MSHLKELHYAFGRPAATASIRCVPQDFKVDEQLSFTLDGSGQHTYLRIQKSNVGTAEVAELLARFTQVKPVSVGYAGLKDKHAVTTQWFSVDLAGKDEPDWRELETENLKLVDVSFHGRKLKKGAIKSNHFEILLRNFDGDFNELEQRLQKVNVAGVPNYFGQQRFGTNDYNLKKADQLGNRNKKIKRHLRSIYLSALRSFLFNQLLSVRVMNDSWCKALSGEILMLEGSHSVFVSEEIDDEIKQRIESGDIHPTGPLWGIGEVAVTKDVLTLEKELMVSWPDRCELLEKEKVRNARRALRVFPKQLKWGFESNTIKLRFSLPTGSYATSVLRELVIADL